MASPIALALARRRGIIALASGATFLHVGTDASTTTFTASTCTITKTIAGTGHLLVLNFGHHAGLGLATITGITGGGTWASAVRSGSGTDDVEIWYCATTTSSGSTSIVVTFSGVTVTSGGEASVAEYSGQAASPLNNTSSSTGTSASPATGSATNTGNNLICGAVEVSVGSLTGPGTSGWSTVGATGGLGLGGYLISTDSSSHSATFTNGSGSQPWRGVVASFKHA